VKINAPITRRCARLLCALGLLAWTGPALAQSGATTRARLQLEAEAGCATRAGLAARVTLRSRRIAFVDAAPDAPDVRVVIGPGEQQVVARLTLAWPDGRSYERQLTASSCEEATDAIALLIVLALDPSARSGGVGEPPPAADGGSATHASMFSLVEVSLGVGGGIAAGIAPGVMPGFGAQLRLAFAGRALWLPALQLGFVHASRSGLREPGGIADFTLDAALLDVCAVGVALGPLAARGCIAAALGSLSTVGSSTYSPGSSARMWTSLGVSLLTALALGDRLAIELRTGVTAPLTRDRFAFAPSIFHRVSVVTLDLQLGLALHFR
jgi:hypothetical protein